MNSPSKSAAIAAILIMAFLTGCGGVSEADLIASAKSSIAKQDMKAAIVQLKTLLQKNPNSGEARFLIGSALLDEKSVAAALAELKRAEALGFDKGLVDPKMARALLASGQFKAVVDTYSGKNMGTPQGQAELHTALAIAQAGTGHPDKVAGELDIATAAIPKYAWALETKARMAAARADYDSALSLLGVVLESEPRNGEAWLLRGAVLASGKKDDVQAIVAFGKALLDPKSAEAAHMSIISLHLTAGRAAEAKQQWELMGQAFPNSAQTAFARVQIAYQEKDYARAKDLLQPLLNAFPKSPVLLLTAGSADKQRGALLLAEAELNKALQVAPGLADARKVLAETYLQMGNPQQASAVLRPLIEAGNADGETVALVAGALLQEGNLQQADVLFAQAAKLKPNDVSIRTAVALTELAKGKADEAFNALQAISSTDTGTIADMALIAAHMRRGEIPAALKAIDRLKAKQPLSPSPAFLRGRIERLRNNNDVARAAFQEALNLEPAHFGAIANLAAIDLAEGKIVAARARFDTAVNANPKNVAAYIGLIDVMGRQGAKPEAITSTLNDAIKANPSEPAPRLWLMATLTDTRDFKAAQAAGQAALASLPDNPDILYAAGNTLVKVGDQQQAISLFSKLASLKPASALPHLRLAEIYAQRKDERAAALSLRRAFDAEPESAAVQGAVLAAMRKSKDLVEPLAAARDLQKRRPQQASGFLFEGDIHIVNKDWNAAVASYKQALGKADPGKRAPISIYSTLSSSGRPADAEKFAADWIRSHPKDATFINRLGEVAMTRKDNALAERRFSEALVISPDNVSALNNLAWLQMNRGAKTALDYATKAAKLAPNEAMVLDTLAQAQSLNRQFDLAIASEQKALSLRPDHAPYRLGLARLLVTAGQVDKAKVELDVLAALGAKFAGQAEVSDLRKKISR